MSILYIPKMIGKEIVERDWIKLYDSIEALDVNLRSLNHSQRSHIKRWGNLKERPPIKSRKEISKKYYEKNKDNLREYQKRYYEKNKDKRREYQRKYNRLHCKRRRDVI